MEFYKIQDYPDFLFQRAYRRKAYQAIRKKVKSIAIYKSGGGLGDLVQSIPLFRSFKEMFPESKLFYLGLYQRPRCNTLFNCIPYIDGYIEYVRPGRESSLKEYLRFRKDFFGKFDLIVDTQSKFAPSFYLWFLASKYFLSRNPFFSHWKSMPGLNKKIHVAAKMYFLARILGHKGADINPAINIPRDYIAAAEKCLAVHSGPFISILPGAGHPYKMWPKENFAFLADKFSSMGYRIILLGAENEKSLLLEVSGLMQSKPIIPMLEEPLFGQDPIYSIGLFKSSILTIGCDCGGLHLSTLAGCPVIGIYGPSSPLKSGPLGKKNVVIYKRFDCSPCRLKDCKFQRSCLKEIIPEDIIQAANFILRDVS
ncbi:MAG: glycosyltransferase family 9 protein [Candidatus Omnitrophica bacterium]|nr:glycosyltransferase family 9 protein [Candidatus Omnitrophota bacterium]